MVIQILDRLAEEHGFRYVSPLAPKSPSILCFFSYTLVTPEDGEYGIAQPNGSFTGMSGMVQRRVQHPTYVVSPFDPLSFRNVTSLQPTSP